MTCCESENGTPGTPKRRRPFDTSDSPTEKGLNLTEEPVLIPLLEDLTIWLSGCLNEDISSDNFIELFEDGVLFCKLGKTLHEKAVDYKERTHHSYPLPTYSIKKWYATPKIGSFFCRDNVCKFISWCKQFGVSDFCLFESNDIVEHRSVRALRNVLICLLDVGKIGVKHGIEPSELVRIDLEIDQEIQQEILQLSSTKKSRIPLKNSSLNSSIASSSEPPSSEESEAEEVMSSSPEPDEEELERIRIKLMSLDEQVRAIVSRCTCKTPFQLDRVGDGKYKLPNTSQIFFVRILRNHVMVRVGGGWDTLDHFIAKHDPCRMKFKQISGTPDTSGVKSKVDCWSDATPPKSRNRSVSMVSTSSSSSTLPPHPWIREDLSPLAKVPRQQPNFSRSSSARYARRLSYSSESEDLNHVAQIRGGSEGSTSSIPDSEFDIIEDKMLNAATFSPLVSFAKKGRKPQAHNLLNTLEGSTQLTSFNQTPRKHSKLEKSRSRSTEKSSESSAPAPRSMIPVFSRSKSCERNNTVSNMTPLKHSKSSDIHQHKMIMTPQRKFSTPTIPTFPDRKPLDIKEAEKELQSCMLKTPKSLLKNPTSATARKVIKSKSTENVTQHLVKAAPAPPRSRVKSGDQNIHKVVLPQRAPKPKTGSALKKSKSADLSKKHVVGLNRLQNGRDEIIMKPDLKVLNSLNTPKSSNRTFRDWLKKRRNEN